MIKIIYQLEDFDIKSTTIKFIDNSYKEALPLNGQK